MAQRADKKKRAKRKRERAKGPHAGWERSLKDIQDQLTAELNQAFQQAEVKQGFGAIVTRFRYWWDHASADECPIRPESPYMHELVVLIQKLHHHTLSFC
jgi:hypothetical protein